MFINYIYVMSTYSYYIYIYVCVRYLCNMHDISYINSVRPPSRSQVIREAVKASVMASTTSRLKAVGCGLGNSNGCLMGFNGM